MSDSGIAVQEEDDQVAEEERRENAVDEPLPPIPDGGLASGMPTWLQQAPGRPVTGDAPSTVDVASLAGSLELPPWLTKLSERLDASRGPVATAEAPALQEDASPAGAVAETVSVVEEVTETPVSDVVAEEASAGRPLGAAVIAAQQTAADRANRPSRSHPPVPAAAPVDAEEFLRGGEITVAPEPRSKVPFIIAAILVVLLAAAAVWFLGA